MCGDVREDGYIFWSYLKDGTQRWLQPQSSFRNRINTLVNTIRTRAKTKKLPFNLTAPFLMSIFPEDSMCPVFGFEMIFGSDGKRGPKINSPSIDRIIPELGYVEGNVVWVSHLANQIKSSATVDQLFMVAQFYQRLLHNPELFLPGQTIH